MSDTELNIQVFIPEILRWFYVVVCTFYIAGFYMRWEEVQAKNNGRWHFVLGAIHIISVVLLWTSLAGAVRYSLYFFSGSVFTCALWLLLNGYCHYYPDCPDKPFEDKHSFFFSTAFKWAATIVGVLAVFGFGFSRTIDSLVDGFHNSNKIRKEVQVETKKTVATAVSTAVQSATTAVAKELTPIKVNQGVILAQSKSNAAELVQIKGRVAKAGKQAIKDARNARYEAQHTNFKSIGITPIYKKPIKSDLPPVRVPFKVKTSQLQIDSATRRVDSLNYALSGNTYNH